MTDTVWELSCNLDDMTPEDIAFAMERLLDAGALDVWTTPIGMKKNRPGIQLSVLSREDRKEELAQCLFRHTTTLGIRQTEHRRYLLRREFAQAETPWGPVRVKTAEGRFKPEYEDLAAIATPVRRLVWQSPFHSYWFRPQRIVAGGFCRKWW